MVILKPYEILSLSECEVAALVSKRVRSTYILRELFSSKLSLKRIALDGYEEDRFWGWRIPMLDPVRHSVRSYRYKNLNQPFDIKYYQKKNTPLVPFYPFLEFITWYEVMKDSSIPIIVSEGEKKASCLASFDKVVISVPGVWAWKSKSIQEDPFRFNLKNRTIFLLFDSDIKTKPSVRQALDEFSIFLHRIGAKPLEITI